MTEIEKPHDFPFTKYQTSFATPIGVTLKIKQAENQGKTPTSPHKEAKWALLVDGQLVEEADPSGKALRDLCSMGEGSYIIATGFEAPGVVQNACRKYKFTVDSKAHELDVAHREFVWQVCLDGKLLYQQGHTLNDNSGTFDVKVPGANGAMIPGTLRVTWVLKEFKWSYDLVVGGTSVPPSWTKAKGPNVGVVPPEIFSAAPAPAETVPKEAQAGYAQKKEAQAPAADSGSPDIVPDNLPQGVSYDPETKTFQANIKNAKTKQYICLGEFASADAAHQKYLEALNRYTTDLANEFWSDKAPDKQLVPAVEA